MCVSLSTRCVLSKWSNSNEYTIAWYRLITRIKVEPFVHCRNSHSTMRRWHWKARYHCHITSHNTWAHTYTPYTSTFVQCSNTITTKKMELTNVLPMHFIHINLDFISAFYLRHIGALASMQLYFSLLFKSFAVNSKCFRFVHCIHSRISSDTNKIKKLKRRMQHFAIRTYSSESFN